jgi:hypothetical protein
MVCLTVRSKQTSMPAQQTESTRASRDPRDTQDIDSDINQEIAINTK